MGHKLQTEFIAGSSHWVAQVPDAPYTREITSTDPKDFKTLARMLVDEFELTDKEQREAWIPLLEEWLKELPEDVTELHSGGAVRDFIYEMF